MMKKLVMVTGLLISASYCLGMSLYSVKTIEEADTAINMIKGKQTQSERDVAQYEQDIARLDELYKTADLAQKIQYLKQIRDYEPLKCGSQSVVSAAGDKLAALRLIKGLLMDQKQLVQDKEYLENK